MLHSTASQTACRYKACSTQQIRIRCRRHRVAPFILYLVRFCSPKPCNTPGSDYRYGIVPFSAPNCWRTLIIRTRTRTSTRNPKLATYSQYCTLPWPAGLAAPISAHLPMQVTYSKDYGQLRFVVRRQHQQIAASCNPCIRFPLAFCATPLKLPIP